MEFLDSFKELTKKLQKDDVVLRYRKAQTEVKLSELFQEKIAKLNAVKKALDVELANGSGNSKNATKLSSELKTLYDEITIDSKMATFVAAKAEIDKLIDSMNYILIEVIKGANPDLVDVASCHSSCGGCGYGGCGGCGGG
ncbi:MAG: YlbF family regulator [Oscillospiraceae bacterium]|jgi:cell fate (sporulation/competence/biofilm development) regulator YlbF (YheA/YmcA/DUF963 family)|nr:YlbF family regulator [Oscillospiraceae bacterium]